MASIKEPQGYKVISENDEMGTREYVIDTPDVLTTAEFLKVSKGRTGSFALCLSTGDVYGMNSKQEWVKI